MNITIGFFKNAEQKTCGLEAPQKKIIQLTFGVHILAIYGGQERKTVLTIKPKKCLQNWLWEQLNSFSLCQEPKITSSKLYPFNPFSPHHDFNKNHLSNTAFISGSFPRNATRSFQEVVFVGIMARKELNFPPQSPTVHGF